MHTFIGVRRQAIAERECETRLGNVQLYLPLFYALAIHVEGQVGRDCSLCGCVGFRFDLINLKLVSGIILWQI